MKTLKLSAAPLASYLEIEPEDLDSSFEFWAATVRANLEERIGFPVTVETLPISEALREAGIAYREAFFAEPAEPVGDLDEGDAALKALETFRNEYSDDFLLSEKFRVENALAAIFSSLSSLSSGDLLLPEVGK